MCPWAKTGRYRCTSVAPQRTPQVEIGAHTPCTQPHGRTPGFVAQGRCPCPPAPGAEQETQPPEPGFVGCEMCSVVAGRRVTGFYCQGAGGCCSRRHAHSWTCASHMAVRTHVPSSFLLSPRRGKCSNFLVSPAEYREPQGSQALHGAGRGGNSRSKAMVPEEEVTPYSPSGSELSTYSRPNHHKHH